MSTKPWPKGSNLDRFLIKDVWDRKLCRIGVPPQFWNPDARLIKFKPVTVGKTKISPTAQRQFIRAYVKHPPRNRPFVTITSGPTDTGALYLGYFLLTRFAKMSHTVAMLDTAQPIQFMERFPEMVLIYNVLGYGTQERIQTVRDTLLRFRSSFKILVVVGVDNPYQWTTDSVGIYPQMVFNVKDMTI